VALAVVLPSPSAGADVIYDDVPAYNQDELPGMCSETSIAMILGWYDTNRFTANWKRFVPWGGNRQGVNDFGIFALEFLIVFVLGTDVEPLPNGDGLGDGMNNQDWENAQTLLPLILSVLDPGAAFTLSYKSRNQGDALSIADIATALTSHGPGVFGTWSTIKYYRNDGTTNAETTFTNHDTAAIGFFQRKKPSTLTSLPAPPPINLTADWLVVQSTWTSDAWGETDPLWINTATPEIATGSISFADFAPGGTPSTAVDDTDDPYEDNDSLDHPAEVSWPLALTGMEANEMDIFSFSAPAGHHILTLSFPNSYTDLYLAVSLPSGEFLFGTKLNDQETVSFDLAEPGTCQAMVLPSAIDGYVPNLYSLRSGPLAGDVDKDGARTLSDLVLILQASSGLSSPPGLQEETLTPALATLVLQALAGLR